MNLESFQELMRFYMLTSTFRFGSHYTYVAVDENGEMWAFSGKPYYSKANYGGYAWVEDNNQEGTVSAEFVHRFTCEDDIKAHWKESVMTI